MRNRHKAQGIRHIGGQKAKGRRQKDFSSAYCVLPIACRLPAQAGAQRGFTLLLASLISSVVLALGIAIWGIALKQVTLSSMSRDSQYAFYAADTAAECALYWDFRYSYFGTSTPPGLDLQTVKCAEKCLETADGTTCQDVPGRPISDPDTYSMTFGLDLFAKYCTEVRVSKCKGTFSESGACTVVSGDPIRTTIHADGYNVKCASINNSSRALQRSVELHY